MASVTGVPPPPEESKVIVSVLASVVIVILEPATNVKISVALPATIDVCPDTSIVSNDFDSVLPPVPHSKPLPSLLTFNTWPAVPIEIRPVPPLLVGTVLEVIACPSIFK